MATIVLASASPRRRELLAAAGILCEVAPVDVDEARHPREEPRAYVMRLALAKAEAGSRRHPGRVVLGADTAVVLEGELFGKPADPPDAARMLRALSGRDHEVLTGFAVIRGGHALVDAAATRVTVAALTPAEIAWYVASGEPMDKAGAYAIQGLFSRFVTRINGSYTSVVGLPVAEVVQTIRRLRPSEYQISE